jgi:hypothetical protein
MLKATEYPDSLSLCGNISTKSAGAEWRSPVLASSLEAEVKSMTKRSFRFA